jgi:hypothetical protein
MTSLPPSVYRQSRQCGTLTFSQPYGPLRPVMGIASLTFLYMLAEASSKYIVLKNLFLNYNVACRLFRLSNIVFKGAKCPADGVTCRAKGMVPLHPLPSEPDMRMFDKWCFDNRIAVAASATCCFIEGCRIVTPTLLYAIFLLLPYFSGGLSNLLYYCSLPAGCPVLQGEPSRVLLRFYGQLHGERALEGLVTEAVIFTMLSESQRGPRLFGVFPGGRLEEYISVSLKPITI